MNCKFSQGESFYNPYIPPVLEELTNKGLIIESEGAQVIPIEDQKSALVVVKSNGGFNYASTDLAALWSVVKTEISKFSSPISASSLPEGTNSLLHVSV